MREKRREEKRREEEKKKKKEEGRRKKKRRRKSKGMESTYVWIMYGILVWKKCMELMFRNVVSWYKMSFMVYFEF